MTSTLSSGTLLGERYRLTDRIAAGGQGEIWRAEDTTLGRTVAVKVLRAEYADNVEFRERFRREAQHSAGLSHPGIAQVFDYNEGHDGSPPYLVMEYVDGESLSTVIVREAPMSPDWVLDILAAAASALAAAHTAGLVHRDVKPGNLLISRDGSVKITDFGIARAVDASALTRTGMVIGTPLYLAPEQATGRPATAESDLYALGVIAYEMLTGRPPFEGHPTAVLLAHRDVPVPPLPASVPGGLVELVRALTAKSPAMRPHPATAVADWATRLRADPATTAVGTRERSAVTPLDQSIPAVAPVTRAGGLTQVLGSVGEPADLAEPSGQAEPVWRRRGPMLLLGGFAAALAIFATAWVIGPPAPDRATDEQRPAATPTASPTAAAKAPPVTQPEPATRVTSHQEHHGGHARHGHGGRHGGHHWH